MNRDDAEEYTQSLGQIASGSYRQIALAKRLGVPKALGLTTEEWVRDRLGGYVRLSISERMEAVKELREKGHSYREIGEAVGISYVQAGRDVTKVTAPLEERQQNEGVIVTNETPLDTLAVLAANEETERAAKALKKREQKANRREEREQELGQKQAALPDKKYGVIVADPEWRFEPYSRDTGMDRAADNHYPTSATEIIASRPVATIAADDCVLLLWATVPMLPDALAVMSAWGFEYKSHCVWAKDRIGTGYWFRNKHELLLLGVKGSVPAPYPGTQCASLIEAPVGEHSAKPEFFLEMIERHYPTLPKIELNRRGPSRPGWDAWGNECAAIVSSNCMHSVA